MVNRESTKRYMIPNGMGFSSKQMQGIKRFVPDNPRTKATNESSDLSPWSQEVKTEVAAWLRANAHELEGPVWSFEEKGGDGIPTRPICVDEIARTLSHGQEELDPEEAIKLAEQKGLLSEFIQTCTPREKKIFLESIYKSQAQIAREMSLSRGRVHALFGKVVRKAAMFARAKGYVSDDSARHGPSRVQPTFGANGESSHIASKQIRGNSLEYLMNSFERMEFSDVQAKLAVMQTTSCTAAVNAMKSTDGIHHDNDPYEPYRSAVHAVTADLSKLRMFRLLLAGPEAMWTDQSPMVQDVHLLRQNPNSAIPTVNVALQKISKIQSDSFEIPPNYAEVFGTNAYTLLTQIAGYSTLNEATKGLDGKKYNDNFDHLAHQIGYVLDTISTVYELGTNWRNAPNSKTKALIDECRKCHDVLTTARGKKDPVALQNQIIHVANEISKLCNTAHTGIEGGSESSVSRTYMTREELDKARASAHMMRLPKLDLRLPPKAPVASPSGGNIA